MSSLNSIKLDASCFHQISIPEEGDKCPICLDPIEKNAQVVGHLFQNQIMHIVHASCWKTYASAQKSLIDDYKCVVCCGTFIGPAQNTSTEGGLSIAEKKLLLALSSKASLSNIKSWNEGVLALAPSNQVQWLLGLTKEQKQQLSLLHFFSDFPIEDRNWFLALSAEQTAIILSLGIDCLKLSLSDREWFLQQSQTRRYFIVSFCTPTIDFIRQERAWLDGIPENQMIKLTPLLKKLDSALWNVRGGILGNLLRKMGMGVYDSFSNWLSGSKLNQEVNRRKTHLILMHEMQGIGKFGDISTSRGALTSEEKNWLCGIYSLDRFLYGSIAAMISPALPSRDQSWLKTEKIIIPSDEYKLINILGIPCTTLTWDVNGQSGEFLDGSFASLVDNSELSSQHKEWLLSLNSQQRSELVSLNSSDFDEQKQYLELDSQVREFLTLIGVSPKALFQKELSWIAKWEQKDIEKARSTFLLNSSLFSKKQKLEDASQVRERIEFLLNCDALSELQSRFLKDFCANPERFFAREKNWLMKLASNEAIDMMFILEVPKLEETREVLRRFELLSMPIATSAFKLCSAESYSRDLLESEREWFLQASEDKQLFETLVRKGAKKGVFCGKDLRWLMEKGTFENELLVSASAAYCKNLALGSGLDPKILAAGYAIGFLATRITNSSSVLTAIAILASVTLLAEAYNEKTFEQGARALSTPRSLQIGSATALGIHSLDTRIVLLAGAIFGGGSTIMVLAFVKFVESLLNGLRRR